MLFPVASSSPAGRIFIIDSKLNRRDIGAAYAGKVKTPLSRGAAASATVIAAATETPNTIPPAALHAEQVSTAASVWLTPDGSAHPDLAVLEDTKPPAAPSNAQTDPQSARMPDDCIVRP